MQSDIEIGQIRILRMNENGFPFGIDIFDTLEYLEMFLIKPLGQIGDQMTFGADFPMEFHGCVAI